MSENQDNHKAILIKSILTHKGYRQYNIAVAKRLGGIEYAVLLCDLIDQLAYLEENNMLVSHVKYGDGLMYYKISQAYDRCAISKDSFETGIKILSSLGFIKDIVKFGIPPVRYFRLDLNVIFEWLFSKNVSKLRKPAIYNEEIRNTNFGNPQTYDNYNESNTNPNNRSPSISPPPPPNKSFSLKEDKISFFDPFKYKLKNGQPVGDIMAKTLAKKMKDPLERSKIIAAVEWYHQQVDAGNPVKKTHESWLQYAITNDMGSKGNRLWKNEMYAKLMKEEHKLHGLEIKKTVVWMDKKDGNRPESIGLNLPEETFANALDNYIKIMKLKD